MLWEVAQLQLRMLKTSYVEKWLSRYGGYILRFVMFLRTTAWSEVKEKQIKNPPY